MGGPTRVGVQPLHHGGPVYGAWHLFVAFQSLFSNAGRPQFRPLDTRPGPRLRLELPDTEFQLYPVPEAPSPSPVHGGSSSLLRRPVSRVVQASTFKSKKL